MSEFFTGVEIAFYPEFVNYWLRFGAPDVTHLLDRRRSLVVFGPGQILGYVRWRANAYGTQDWRIVIMRTGAPPQVVSRLAGVHPGADILLSAIGKVRVKRVLAQLDALEAAGFDLPKISPAYVRHLHNRIAISRPVRCYSHNQHAASLAAQTVRS
ncbi:MAG: DUF2840 domain-containing protein [Hyphomicrobiales bacterium]|jgi:hypothetical protein